jgi:plastocyanin
LGSVLAVIGPLPAQASPAAAKPPTLTRPSLTPVPTSHVLQATGTTTTTTVKPPVRVAGAASSSVSIIDFAFSPASITVHVGDTITWVNNSQSGVAHTSTSDAAGWDSGILNKGASFSHSFGAAGSFTYHCNVHPFMHGTVVVNAVTTTTTTTRPGSTTTTRPGSTATTGGVQRTTVTTSASGLATTGAPVAPLIGIGLAALLTGLLAVSLAGRRRLRS